MRLFLALKVPVIHFTDQRFKKLNTNLKKSTWDHQWLDTEHLHIPLAHLGDVGRGTFLSLYNRLYDVIKTHHPFELKLSGLWGHPHQKEATLLWIGVQNSRYLRELEGNIADALSVDESAFIRPHIPLIYLSSSRDVTDLISPFKNFDFGSVMIDDIRLIEQLPGTHQIRMLGSHSLYEPPGVSHEIL